VCFLHAQEAIVLPQSSAPGRQIETWGTPEFSSAACKVIFSTNTYWIVYSPVTPTRPQPRDAEQF
jgi:hypothetical protein